MQKSVLNTGFKCLRLTIVYTVVYIYVHVLDLVPAPNHDWPDWRGRPYNLYRRPPDKFGLLRCGGFAVLQ
jgi:hypothetical protein